MVCCCSASHYATQPPAAQPVRLHLLWAGVLYYCSTSLMLFSLLLLSLCVPRCCGLKCFVATQPPTAQPPNALLSLPLLRGNSFNKGALDRSLSKRKFLPLRCYWFSQFSPSLQCVTDNSIYV
ncbi:hypothetical protein U1Q18_009212 [Sarracenia purpurea var. burkii]